MTTYAVIDFETTGLSPAHGAKPTEIAIVLIEGNRIIDRYQSLMNPGVPIPYFIQQLTGITDSMVRKAPSVADVMQQAADFAGDIPLLAHNASFDRKFWEAELKKIKRKPRLDFACSLLLSRRLYPATQNHKLETLVRELKLPQSGDFHRALADAECTAHLLLRINEELKSRYKVQSVDHELLLAIQNANKSDLEKCIRKHGSLA